MHRCECGDTPAPSERTHIFADLNGLPYLVGEYMNRNLIANIDRSSIKHDIYIDTKDAMRAIVNIDICDMPTRSDGSPYIAGNNSKAKRFLDMLSKNSHRLNGTLPVIRGGIIIRVNYQLETPGARVIRSTVETLRIDYRNYYVVVDPRQLNNNALVVNFSNSMISTINEFTHGKDRMSIRITNIQLFYEAVDDASTETGIKQSFIGSSCGYGADNITPGSNNEYYYHEGLQHRHYLGDPPFNNSVPGGFTCENDMLRPPHWAMYNEFYHFDKDGRRIILHQNVINDPLRKVRLIPCGSVAVNRTFMINPGHRLIFKVSIWKNDVTSFYDTLNVAKALKTKFYNCCDHDQASCSCGHHGQHDGCDCGHDCYDHQQHEHDHEHHDYHRLVEMLREERKKNELQGRTINELLDRVSVLEGLITEGGTGTPEEPPIESVDPPDSDCECGCDHTEINNQITEITDRLDDITDIDPMPEEVIDSIYEEVLNEQEGEI